MKWGTVSQELIFEDFFLGPPGFKAKWIRDRQLFLDTHHETSCLDFSCHPTKYNGNYTYMQFTGGFLYLQKYRKYESFSFQSTAECTMFCSPLEFPQNFVELRTGGQIP